MSIPQISADTNLQDLLSPCSPSLTGPEILTKYYLLLNDFLFVEDNLETESPIARAVKCQSFEKEEHIVIYKFSNTYILEYSSTNISIWDTLMQETRVSPKRNPPPLNYEDILIKKNKKTIPSELAIPILNAWQEMTKITKLPEKDSGTIIDGTMYLFSSGPGVCGMSIGRNGKNTSILVDIVEKLIDLSKIKKDAPQVEGEIARLLVALHDNLTCNTPDADPGTVPGPR